MNASLPFMTSEDDCIVCDAGHACSVGSDEQTACLPGSYGDAPGRATCELCPAGKFTPDEGNTECRNCTKGYLCVEGSSAPQPCPGGTHADQDVLDAVGYLFNLTEHCISCPHGTFCPVGTSAPNKCAPGTYNALSQQEQCFKCNPGSYQSLEGQMTCNAMR